MKRVLVIGGGNHHNALGVVRALGMDGYEVEFIAVDGTLRHYVSSSRYVSRFHALESVEELAAYLLYRPMAEEKEVLVSCADSVTEHLNIYQTQLQERYIIPGVPEAGRMTHLMDKTVMMEMAARQGLWSPRVWRLPDEFESVTYPCITKAFVSSHGSKGDIRIFDDPASLEAFTAGCRDEVFVQDYVRKTEEVQFIGCSLRGGETIVIPGMSRILRSQPNTNTGLLEYGPIDPFYNDIVERSKRCIADCHYSGLFSIEFIRDAGDNVYFLEVNFRNDGNAWCVTAAGVNLPAIWVTGNCGANQQVARIVMMPEFQDFKQVLQRKVSLKQWWRDFRRADVLMEYHPNDRRPFFQFLWDLAFARREWKPREQYLLRLDDACPQMDAERWSRVEAILDRYAVRPLVGIIPHNEDANTIPCPAAENFWAKALAWERKGWAIALHGYNHVYISRKGMEGLNPEWSRSEFAGLPYAVQAEKIRRGFNILTEYGLHPRYFFAPSHTFDVHTLEALRRETTIRSVSDTIAARPYRYDDFLIIPQQIGHCTRLYIPGIWTICLHPNSMNATLMANFEVFLARYAKRFTTFDAVSAAPCGRLSLLDRTLRRLYFLKRRLRGLK